MRLEVVLLWYSSPTSALWCYQMLTIKFNGSWEALSWCQQMYYARSHWNRRETRCCFFIKSHLIDQYIFISIIIMSGTYYLYNDQMSCWEQSQDWSLGCKLLTCLINCHAKQTKTKNPCFICTLNMSQIGW